MATASAGSSNMQYASIISRNEQMMLREPETDEIKPSIFDVIAQENMNALFRTSFNHLFDWISSYSSRVARYKKYSNELYLVIHSSIEYFYLKAYDALLSEHFYGMKRVRLSGDRKRLLSILVSIVVPYLKAKLDEVYEELERAVDDPTGQPSEPATPKATAISKLVKKFKKLVLKFYPYFHLVWSSVIWIYRFKFMINKSDVHSPLLRLLNLKLVYSLDDLNQKVFSNITNQTLGKRLFTHFVSYLNYGFTSLLFFIQFLQWYNFYSDNSFNGSNEVLRPLTGFVSTLKSNSSKFEGNGQKCIPPPVLPDKLVNSKMYKQLKEHNFCPLCSGKRRNESALTVSGFVFCYTCIFKYVKEHGKCPLTCYPCDTKNIIRIYTSTDAI